MKVKYNGPLGQVEYGGFGRFNKGEVLEVDDIEGATLLSLGGFEKIDEEEIITGTTMNVDPIEYMLANPIKATDFALESENVESETENKEED